MSLDQLDALRAELSDVDRQLLELVARRTELSLDIGRVKQSLGRGTRDFTREKVVLSKAAAAGARLGLPPGLSEALMLRLINASLSVQELDRIGEAGSGDGQRALVIGGAGKMGRWFVTFLAAQGYEVHVADPSGPVAQTVHHDDWSTLDLDHDLIVVAAPLHATNDILLAMAKRAPSGLVFDIGSLKTPLRDGLTALAEAGTRVTSVHPMFGPDTNLLSGRHVLFIDLGHAEATASAKSLFAATMAMQADMDLDTHDKLIAFVLGLSHALNLAFAEALASSGEALPMLSRISSTTFDAQLAVSSRVSAENPRLYYEIQSLNDYGRTSLDALARAVDHLRALVSAGDEGGFVRMMEDGRDYLLARGGH